MSEILPLDNEFFDNPYPLYAELRKHSPIVWDRELSRWLVFRYSDVRSVLKNTSVFTSERAALVVPPDLREKYAHIVHHLRLWMVSNDAPRHGQLRSVVEHRFTSSGVARAMPAVAEVAESLFQDLLDNGGGDFVDDYAFMLPALVITDLLGANREDWLLLKRWADLITIAAGSGASSPEKCEEVSVGLREATTYFTGLIQKKIAEPGDDLVSDLAGMLREDSEELRQEVISQSVLLFWAGHATTQNLLSNGLVALLTNPSQLDRLLANPAMISDAVLEFLRFDSPVQAITRMAKSDTTIAGQRIKSGDGVMVFTGSANRDPDEYPEPDTLDLSRRPTNHMAFGYGPHYCIGAGLARAEAEFTLELLLPYLSGVQVDFAKVRRSHNMVHHGFDSIPLSIGAQKQVVSY